MEDRVVSCLRSLNIIKEVFLRDSHTYRTISEAIDIINDLQNRFDAMQDDGK